MGINTELMFILDLLIHLYLYSYVLIAARLKEKIDVAGILVFVTVYLLY